MLILCVHIADIWYVNVFICVLCRFPVLMHICVCVVSCVVYVILCLFECVYLLNGSSSCVHFVCLYVCPVHVY